MRKRLVKKVGVREVRRRNIMQRLVRSPEGRVSLARRLLASSFNKAPCDMVCPTCSADFPEFGIHVGMFLGPYGVLECKSCGYRMSGLQYLGSQMITVTPIGTPPPAEGTHSF